MKLLRYGPEGSEKPGLLDKDGKIRDLSGVIADVGGAALSDFGWAKSLDIESLPVVEGNPRLGACVAGTGKFICIGLNYADHAAETGEDVPPEPVVFRCDCDADRITQVLKGYSAEERAGLADPDGIIRAKCEFCGKVHEIGPESLS